MDFPFEEYTVSFEAEWLETINYSSLNHRLFKPDKEQTARKTMKEK